MLTFQKGRPASYNPQIHGTWLYVNSSVGWCVRFPHHHNDPKLLRPGDVRLVCRFHIGRRVTGMEREVRLVSLLCSDSIGEIWRVEDAPKRKQGPEKEYKMSDMRYVVLRPAPSVGFVSVKAFRTLSDAEQYAKQLVQENPTKPEAYVAQVEFRVSQQITTQNLVR